MKTRNDFNFTHPVLFILVLLALALQLLTGCSMMAGSKKKSESLQTAEHLTARQETTFRKVADGNPGQSPELTIKGKQNTVTYNFPVPPPGPPPHEEVEISQTSGQKAGTEMSWLIKSRWAIPIGLSILLVAVGLFALWFMLGKIRQSSAGAAAAFTLADETIASLVERAGAKLAMSTTPEENARTSAEMALLEKARRKLGLKKPTATPP